MEVFSLLILIILAILFFVLSILFFCGKGSQLIAGYNTMSEQEKEQFDKAKICKAMGVLCLVCCTMLIAMAIFIYCVEAGLLNENYMLAFSLVFIAVILATIIATIKYVNNSAQK